MTGGSGAGGLGRGGSGARDATSDAANDPFLAEILGQPAVLRRAGQVVATQANAAGRVSAAVRAAGDRAGAVILTGMGSSLEAASAAATVLAGRGIRAVEMDASELLHLRRPALRPADVVIVVSQSGRSAELVRLVELIRGASATFPRPALVAITNGVDNPVAMAADVALDTGVGREVAPSTGTFGGSLIALAAIVGGVEVATRAAASAATSAEAILAAAPELADRLRAWLADLPSMVAVGRGTGRAAAAMGGLILKEAGHFHAEGLGSAAFRHGPLELAGPGLAVAVVATEAATLALEVALAAELVAAGSPVLWIGPAGQAPAGALAVALPATPEDDDGSRILAPAVAVIPLQLLAWRLAQERPEAPGTFARAAKVTLRE